MSACVRSVCGCVCWYVCVMYLCMSVCMYVCVHNVRMYVCVCFVCSGCLSACMYVSMCVMPVCMCVMYACMCVVSDVMSWRGPANVMPTSYHLPVWAGMTVAPVSHGSRASPESLLFPARAVQTRCPPLNNINYPWGTISISGPVFLGNWDENGAALRSPEPAHSPFLCTALGRGACSPAKRGGLHLAFFATSLCKSYSYLSREYILCTRHAQNRLKRGIGEKG